MITLESITHYSDELLLAALSIIAVGVSVFRARARQLSAGAAAVTELAEVSHDLRERINELERQNRDKDTIIADLRQQAALIPILQSQMQYLTQELSAVKVQHQQERDRLLHIIAQKDDEITGLRKSG